MTNEEVAVALTDHKNEIGSLKHRVKDLEELSNTIQELVLSVRELALNMKSMIKEQERQAQHICELESKPAKRWDTIVTSIISAIVGGIIGIVFANIF